MRILVVDDDAAVRESLRRALGLESYEVELAGDGAEALGRLDEKPDLDAPEIDAMVLDVSMPRLDGLEVCRRLRKGGSALPILMLTARDEVTDRVAGLDAGADDYVVKPFALAELVARVDAVLRRARPALGRDEPIVLNGLTIDADARRAFADGEEVALTAREFDLLLFLARHPGRAFSRDELMEAVWDFSFYTDTSTVTVHVRRLREKIEPDPANPVFIVTLWGVGYRFDPSGGADDGSHFLTGPTPR